MDTGPFIGGSLKDNLFRLILCAAMAFAWREGGMPAPEIAPSSEPQHQLPLLFMPTVLIFLQ